MELRNISKKDFKAIFGKEGYDLIKGHDMSVVIVHDDSVLTVEGVGVGAGGVMGHDFNDGKGPVMTLFMNPSVIYANMNELDRNSARAGIILRSYLVHELTHIKQHEEGRLTGEGDQLYWEGKPVNPPADMEAYVLSPWEIEAFAAQRAYVTGSSIEQATKEYLRDIGEYLKQAA